MTRRWRDRLRWEWPQSMCSGTTFQGLDAALTQRGPGPRDAVASAEQKFLDRSRGRLQQNRLIAVTPTSLSNSKFCMLQGADE